MKQSDRKRPKGMALLMNVKPYFTTYLYSILAVILMMNF